MKRSITLIIYVVIVAIIIFYSYRLLGWWEKESQDSRWLDMAVAENNVLLCRTMNYQKNAIACVAVVVNHSDSVSPCNQLDEGSYLRAECYKSFARYKKDPTVCLQFPEEGSQRLLCFAIFCSAGFDDACSKIPSELKDEIKNSDNLDITFPGNWDYPG